LAPPAAESLGDHPLRGEEFVPRFDRLEFDQPPERSSVPSSKASDPDRDEHYWLRLADEDRRQGLYENALRFCSRALELDRSLVRAWVGQVQMLIALGEYPEAELWSRKALELFRNHGDLLAGRAQASCRLGDRKQAQMLCDAALTQPEPSAYRWIVRGELLVASKDRVDRHCFDKAVQLEHDWLVPLEIAQIYRHYRVPSKALSRVRQALEQAPDNAYCWFVRSQCEEELGLTAPALTSLKRCLELVPGHVEAQRRRQALARQGWSWKTSWRRFLSFFHRESRSPSSAPGFPNPIPESRR
jgi:tetratricopeptide (TPR) repeat protein